MYLILIASLSMIIMEQQIYIYIYVQCNSIYDSFDCKYIIIKNNKVQLKVYS